jgi:cytochrome P450
MIFLPGILEKVRAEILPAFDAFTGKLTNLPHLINNSPLLNSMFQEVLRFTSASQSIRKVEEDTVIAGYTFLEGSLVMMPAKPYHFDPAIFGDDAGEYVPDRFMRDEKPGQKNVNTKMLRAFGGGTILCPGRFFAANEILAAVATLLHRFEMHVMEGTKMPKPSPKEPTVGTYLAEHDITVRIRVRT